MVGEEILRTKCSRSGEEGNPAPSSNLLSLRLCEASPDFLAYFRAQSPVPQCTRHQISPIMVGKDLLYYRGEEVAIFLPRG